MANQVTFKAEQFRTGEVLITFYKNADHVPFAQEVLSVAVAQHANEFAKGRIADYVWSLN